MERLRYVYLRCNIQTTIIPHGIALGQPSLRDRCPCDVADIRCSPTPSSGAAQCRLGLRWRIGKHVSHIV